MDVIFLKTELHDIIMEVTKSYHQTTTSQIII